MTTCQKFTCFSCCRVFDASGLSRHLDTNEYCRITHNQHIINFATKNSPPPSPPDSIPFPDHQEEDPNRSPDPLIGRHFLLKLSPQESQTLDSAVAKSGTPIPTDHQSFQPRIALRSTTRQATSSRFQPEPPAPLPESSPVINFDPQLSDFVGEILKSQRHVLTQGSTNGTSQDVDSSSAAAQADPITGHGTPPAESHPPKVMSISLLSSKISYKLGDNFNFPFHEQSKMYSDRFYGFDKVLAKMHYSCYKAGAPQYLGDELLKILQEGRRYHGFDLSSQQITQRESLMKRLQKSIPALPPKSIIVNLESGLTTTVIAFNLSDQLQRHLLSSAYADIDNLNLTEPKEDPFSSKIHPHDLPSCTYQEIKDAEWYRDTMLMYHQYIESGQYLLHPFTAYMDKTGVDGVEKNSLEPFAITSAVLGQQIREKAENWILLGYIPSLKSLRKKRSKSTTSNSRSMALRDYHQCLSILLEQLKNLMKEKPAFMFRRGDIVGVYRIICPLGPMVGDNLSNDGLAQRVADYTETCPRLSRRCLCTFLQSDQPIHKCHILPESLVKKLSYGALGVTYGRQDITHVGTYSQFQNVIPESPNFARWKVFLDAQGAQSKKLREATLRIKQRRMAICDEILHKVLGCHSLLNAFWGIDFGPNQNGILSATTTDLMHTIEEGLIPMILEVFFHLMPVSLLNSIDQYVESLFGIGKNRTREKDYYPRVTFRQGFTKLTNLSASERLGQLFMLSIIFQTKIGENLLLPRFDDEFDIKRLKRKHQMTNKKNEKKSGSAGRTDLPSVPLPPVGSNIALASDGSSVDLEAEALDSSDSEILDQPSLDWNQIKDFLSQIHLGFVHEHLFPYLPTYHQTLLQKVLKEKIRPRWKDSADSIITDNFPDLDYCPMTFSPDSLPNNSSSTPDWLPSANDVERFWTPTVTRHNKETRNESPRSVALSPQEFVYLVETILSFHSCVKNPSYILDRNADEDQVADPKKKFAFSLSMMLRVLVHGIDRGEGTKGWKLRKVLELSHLLPDILSFGSADGFNSSTGERNLKIWAKLPSQTAQKRSAVTHCKQTASRVHEGLLLRLASEGSTSIEHTKKDSTGQTSVYGEKFHLCTETGVFRKLIGKSQRRVVSNPLSPSAVQWFMNEYQGERSRTIPIYTQFKIGDGDICRAHANYRNTGPWYDYVFISPDDSTTNIPSRLAAIWFDQTKDTALGTMKVLVQVGYQDYQCKERNKKSFLFSHWKMESIQEPTGNGSKVQLRAKFKSFVLDDIVQRIFCVDVSSNLSGDPFYREGDKAEHGSMDIIFTDRWSWPHMFLDSPLFLRQVSGRRSRGQGRKRKRSQEASLQKKQGHNK